MHLGAQLQGRHASLSDRKLLVHPGSGGSSPLRQSAVLLGELELLSLLRHLLLLREDLLLLDRSLVDHCERLRGDVLMLRH
jgi:hypothetical protein